MTNDICLEDKGLSKHQAGVGVIKPIDGEAWNYLENMFINSIALIINFHPLAYPKYLNSTSCPMEQGCTNTSTCNTHTQRPTHPRTHTQIHADICTHKY